MKFRFLLETLRKARKREEEMAQKEYLEARAQLDAVLNKIQQMYKAIDESRLDISRIQFSGEPHGIERIKGQESFIAGQLIRIRNERQVAREIMQVVERKQEILLQKSTDFKIIDRLKDKKREEFRLKKRKQEEKAMDDLAVLRSKRRAG